jgi:hypothetical protein
MLPLGFRSWSLMYKTQWGLFRKQNLDSIFLPVVLSEYDTLSLKLNEKGRLSVRNKVLRKDYLDL